MSDGSSGGGSSSANGAPPLFERFRRFAGLAPRGSAESGTADGADEAAEPPSPARDSSSAALRAIQENVRRLSEFTVEDAMVSRAEVEALEEGASFDEVVEAFRNGRHSRLPVYRETLDDPLGFVHVKDIFKLYGVETGMRGFRLRDHMHAALMAPPTMPAAALLQQMRTERVHMAFVIDEYGGVDGLVTNEDLVELIVGDIVDEHDDENVEWTRESDDVWLVDGRASIKEFEREIGVELYDEDEEVDTLGGLVTALNGRVPQTGETLLHPEGHAFDILEADPRRVKRIRLRLARPRAEEATPVAASAETAASGSGEGQGDA